MATWSVMCRIPATPSSPQAWGTQTVKADRFRVEGSGMLIFYNRLTKQEPGVEHAQEEVSVFAPGVWIWVEQETP